MGTQVSLSQIENQCQTEATRLPTRRLVSLRVHCAYSQGHGKSAWMSTGNQENSHITKASPHCRWPPYGCLVGVFLPCLAIHTLHLLKQQPGPHEAWANLPTAGRKGQGVARIPGAA